LSHPNSARESGKSKPQVTVIPTEVEESLDISERERVNQETRNAGKDFLEISHLQSTFGNSSFGGIAQLVERQLCKLEVRGSNPLASKNFAETKFIKPPVDDNLVRPVGGEAHGLKAKLKSRSQSDGFG
jgi:hypothetical protein